MVGYSEGWLGTKLEPIRIDRGKEIKPGIWEYRVASFNLEGRSRQPLLGACRQIKSILGDTKDQMAVLFPEGGAQWTMKCPIDIGAAWSTTEPDRGRIHFVKYQEFNKNIS